MSQHQDPIVVEFISESKDIIRTLEEELEKAEAGLEQSSHLENYGQIVDRILGGAKTLAVNLPGEHKMLDRIGDYAGVCKAVGYKACQIKNNPDFYSICVALLMDVTEVLKEMLSILESKQPDPKEVISSTLVERLKWVSGKFSAETRGSVSVQKKDEKMNQEEIDSLLKKLGVG